MFEGSSAINKLGTHTNVYQVSVRCTFRGQKIDDGKISQKLGEHVCVILKKVFYIEL